MRYRFLDDRTGLLRLDDKGYIVLAYIYRDVEALLADGYVFRRLVTDRHKYKGKEHCKIYPLYDIKADDFTVVYALLDTSLEIPIYTVHEPFWYTKCDNSDIVTSVVLDTQVMRYFRDMPHDETTFAIWRRLQHCYGLYPNTEFILCNPMQYPVHACIGAVLSVVKTKGAIATFTARANPVTATKQQQRQRKEFSCSVHDIPYLRVQRIVKGDFTNGILDI